MKNASWLASAISDLRERYGVSLLGKDPDWSELYFLIRILESDPSSLIGAMKQKKETKYTQDQVLMGELLRSYIYANSKNKKTISFPWDKKEQNSQKIQSAVISKEAAERIFKNMRGKQEPPLS